MRNDKKDITGEGSKTLTLVFVVCFGLAVTGCASNRSGPLRDFESMSIQTKTRPADGLHAQADNDATMKGAKIGAGGGAAAGAATGLACGPWLVLCVPTLAIFGAATGALAGSVAGQVVDITDVIPAEKVETILADIEDRRDFFTEMRDGVSSALPKTRQATVADAKAVIYVGPKKIEFVQTESSHMALRMTATLYAEWNREKRTPRKDRRLYTKTTAEMPVEYWLSSDGAAFDAGFTECIDEIVQMMAWDLAPPER
jgi:hypothetical protein